ncbi:hypothetical protein Pla110_34140 [Polystyrenella longa]|uniref:Uncharacterized protein n=1 Tax=Polystyrenella longa TaxID=2528007 RepID=A0A518CR32_9PLAN|nr:hypothetical protein [Polystyrenella longa]QDU81670.1 hypothetical protein Pla110_34140 [Polystyrenella longa]
MKPFRVACPSCQKRLTINKPELVGKRVKCPQCKNPLVIKPPTNKPTSNKLGVLDSPNVAPTQPVPQKTKEASSEPAGVIPQLNIPEDDLLLNRQKRRRRKSSGSKWIVIGIFLLLSAGAMGGFLYVNSTAGPNQPVTSASSPKPVSKPVAASAAKTESNVLEIDRGKPFTFEYIPTGARVVFHWRPAALQQAGDQPGELWQCSGALLPWLEKELTGFTGLSSADVETVTCYLIPGPRGQLPSFVYKFKPIETFDLQAWVNGQEAATDQQDGFQVYAVGEQRLFWLDDQTGMSVPSSLLEEAITTGTDPLPMTAGLDQLISRSDSDAEVSILFDLKAVEIGMKDWIPSREQQVLQTFLSYWGDDTEAVLWDLNLENDQLHSSIQLQASPFAASKKLQQQWQANIQGMGKMTWQELRNKALHSVGAQTVLARFPAMIQLASRFTTVDVEKQRVTMNTTLSERAAPNLTLASWLYWREQILPESAVTAAPVTTETVKTKSLVDRLQATLFIDFRLTPLQEAIEQIGQESKIVFEIDGDALKNEGYTQNMQQNYNLGEVTVETALAHLMKQYPKMALVLNEADNKVIVTTKSAATAKQQTPYAFPTENQ